MLKRNFVHLDVENLKPSGISDFTAPAALNAVPHRRLLRNDIILASAANSKIAQLRLKLIPIRIPFPPIA